MKIGKKSLYFIIDKYYSIIDDSFLLRNKENGNCRPCFLAAKQENKIIWIIPITSKIDKFKKIYSQKVQKHGYCNTIVINKFLGKDCAFLIQNMFPITEDFIMEKYEHGKNKSPVTIDDNLANEIIQKFNEVLFLVKSGKKGLVFPDVLNIEKKLLEIKSKKR